MDTSRGIRPDGEKLRSTRRSRGLTQEQLAIEANCSVRSIRNAEQGKNLDPSTLLRLANALKLAFVELTADPSSVDGDRDLATVESWIKNAVAGDIAGLGVLTNNGAELILNGSPLTSAEKNKPREKDLLRNLGKIAAACVACFSKNPEINLHACQGPIFAELQTATRGLYAVAIAFELTQGGVSSVRVYAPPQVETGGAAACR